jgi:hypothetical protein
MGSKVCQSARVRGGIDSLPTMIARDNCELMSEFAEHLAWDGIHLGRSIRLCRPQAWRWWCLMLCSLDLACR